MGIDPHKSKFLELLSNPQDKLLILKSVKIIILGKPINF